MREIRLWSESLEGLTPSHVLELEADEAHHFANVLRGKVGFEVILMDGLGREARGTCVEKAKRKVLVRIDGLQSSELAPSPVTLRGPIPKGKRFPYMLEKCQELGLGSWGPLATEHSVREELGVSGREKMEERLREACKQSRNPWLLQLDEEMDLPSSLSKPSVKVVLDVNAPPLWELSSFSADQPIDLFYGPEAGWSEGERGAFREAGAHFLGLSFYHLRMETAAVVGAAVLLEKVGHRPAGS